MSPFDPGRLVSDRVQLGSSVSETPPPTCGDATHETRVTGLFPLAVTWGPDVFTPVYWTATQCWMVGGPDDESTNTIAMATAC